jgi:uncharacterized delta-60 repeat protein
MLIGITRKGLGIALALNLLLEITVGLVRDVVYAADGDLDPAFNGSGKVITDFIGTNDEARAVAIQPDGKIVVVGSTLISGNNYNFAVARYNPNGTPDTTFSGDGKLTTDFFGDDDGAYGVAIQPDGKILVAGGVRSAPYGYYFGLARYNSDGTLDADFFGQGPGGGRSIAYFGTDQEESVANSVAIQSNGKIVLAGYTRRDGATNFGLARFNPNGSLDNSFDGDGLVVTDFFGGVDEARAVVIQAGGTVVAVGNTQRGGSNYNFAVARYNPNGSLDTSLNGNGKVDVSFFGGDDGAYGMAIQHDSKIVLVGSAFVNNNYSLAVARLNPNGSLDTSFNGIGKFQGNIGDGGGTDEARGVALQPDGKIVLAGYAPVGGVNNFALVRINPNGGIDSTFGSAGILTTAFGGGVAIANGVAIQADGRIVAVGTAFMGATNYDLAVARYQVGALIPTPLPASTAPPVPTATATPKTELTPTPTPKPAATATPTLKPAPTATSTPSPTDSRFFHETGHSLKGLFLKYWNEHGGLAQQGYPITEEIQEVSDTDGKVYTMQYFERAVFEYHPENQPPFNVLLSLLGAFYYNEKYSGNAPNQHANPDNPRKFTETGKTIGGAFRQYWEQHGGLAQQGYPISDEFQEKSQTDGNIYTVQYFQRAVFEFHPENQPPFNLLLSLLGVFYHEKKHVGGS